MSKVQLREVAFARSGDKGNTSNVGVIPYNEDDYEWLKRELTVEKVAGLYGELVKGEIRRYEFDGIKSLNFVMEEALSGGVSRSLNLDAHGKSMGNLILRLEIER
ncbi:AtuA-related protein [Metabacillus arenae]|uniref:AtuA-like ferredoxin-fold domain-containing protein n=1 Tax=Metabacillus arenae TaxID=2771434 RepID=A0A926RXS4_9BACI|nr:hypothetical protein [Metabacillus arenae]MBD1380990.1 hypothetical protein [Metabacillus arenae]